MTEHTGHPEPEHHFTNKIVKMFLDSNLSLILILLATIIGIAALWIRRARRTRRSSCRWPMYT